MMKGKERRSLLRSGSPGEEARNNSNLQMARREVKLILWVDVYLHYRSPMIIARSAIIDHHFRIVRAPDEPRNIFVIDHSNLSLTTGSPRYLPARRKVSTYLLETSNYTFGTKIESNSKNRY